VSERGWFFGKWEYRWVAPACMLDRRQAVIPKTLNWPRQDIDFRFCPIFSQLCSLSVHGKLLLLIHIYIYIYIYLYIQTYVYVLYIGMVLLLFHFHSAFVQMKIQFEMEIILFLHLFSHCYTCCCLFVILSQPVVPVFWPYFRFSCFFSG